jgi:hypothetical protein
MLLTMCIVAMACGLILVGCGGNESPGFPPNTFTGATTTSGTSGGSTGGGTTAGTTSGTTSGSTTSGPTGPTGPTGSTSPSPSPSPSYTPTLHQFLLSQGQSGDDAQLFVIQSSPSPSASIAATFSDNAAASPTFALPSPNPTSTTTVIATAAAVYGNDLYLVNNSDFVQAYAAQPKTGLAPNNPSASPSGVPISTPTVNEAVNIVAAPHEPAVYVGEQTGASPFVASIDTFPIGASGVLGSPSPAPGTANPDVVGLMDNGLQTATIEGSDYLIVGTTDDSSAGGFALMPIAPIGSPTPGALSDAIDFEAHYGGNIMSNPLQLGSGNTTTAVIYEGLGGYVASFDIDTANTPAITIFTSIGQVFEPDADIQGLVIGTFGTTSVLYSVRSNSYTTELGAIAVQVDAFVLDASGHVTGATSHYQFLEPSQSGNPLDFNQPLSMAIDHPLSGSPQYLIVGTGSNGDTTPNLYYIPLDASGNLPADTSPPVGFFNGDQTFGPSSLFPLDLLF